MRQCGQRQCIPTLDCIVPMICKSEYFYVKSGKDHWLRLPVIVMPSIPHSSCVSEWYLKWLTECNAKVRKGIYANLVPTKKGMTGDASSQSGKKKAKKPKP